MAKNKAEAIIEITNQVKKDAERIKAHIYSAAKELVEEIKKEAKTYREVEYLLMESTRYYHFEKDNEVEMNIIREAERMLQEEKNGLLISRP